jgi:excisionase family DNA binding protein
MKPISTLLEEPGQLQTGVADRQTLTLTEAAAILGIARSTAYQLASEDRLPVPVIRLGRRVVVARAAIERLIDPKSDEAA